MKGGGIMLAEPTSPLHRPKLGALLHSDQPSLHNTNHHHDNNTDEDSSHHCPSSASTTTLSSNNTSPLYLLSPLNNHTTTSPFTKSPWLLPSTPLNHHNFFPRNGLIGSLIREEGHVYSLAVSKDLLYTGSESKNIRVWKNLKDFTGFKSSSGLVKAIVISGEKIFTGHQDGKIRVWNPTTHKRIGSLPTFKDYVKNCMNPKNNNKGKIKHVDAVSCLSLDKEHGLLYSGSWDKTVKVWSVWDSKCLESINAHGDAVNAVVVGFYGGEGLVFTGSADGTVKMWKREHVTRGEKKRTKHVMVGVLLEKESAVTALAVNRWCTVVYGGSSDGVVNFWERDMKNGVVLHGGVLRGHKLAVLCVAVAGSLVMSGSADKSVCVWKREESGKHTWLSILTGHTGPVKCIAAIEEIEEEEEEEEGESEDDEFHDQKWMVYTGSLDKSVKVWRVSENAPELRMIQGWVPPHDSWGREVSFPSPRKNKKKMLGENLK